MNYYTVLHYVVAADSDILDMLFGHDAPAANSVLNSVAIGPSQAGDTAMTIALKKRHESLVTKLLSLGAKPDIPFDDYIKLFISKYDHAKNWNPEQSMQTFRQYCVQPVLIAATNEMPRAGGQLLANGADASILDATAHDILQNPNYGRWRTGASVLDIVRQKLASLREYDGEVTYDTGPEHLYDESFYLSGLEASTYQHWVTSRRFQECERRNTKYRLEFEKKVNEAEGGGATEKKAAVAKLLKEFEAFEKELIDAGAKTFQEMHRELPQTAVSQHHAYIGGRPRKSQLFMLIVASYLQALP
jgi:hypothetical protein